MSDRYPDELLYHPEHDWALIEGDEATFGITWYAQDALGDVVFYEPPQVGAMVVANESYGELESVKAVSDVVSPLDGEVIAINDEVVENPEQVNTDPYGAWLIKVRLTDTGQTSQLLSAEQYTELVGE